MLYLLCGSKHFWVAERVKRCAWVRISMAVHSWQIHAFSLLQKVRRLPRWLAWYRSLLHGSSHTVLVKFQRLLGQRLKLATCNLEPSSAIRVESILKFC